MGAYKRVYPKYNPIEVESTSYHADSIEVKLEKLITNKEPIGKDVPLRYTERSQGILPEFDIRSDRFDIAQTAMEKVHKSNIAKRDAKPKMDIIEGGKENDGEPKPIQANDVV